MFLKLMDLFTAFFRVSLLSFGGGYTFIPLIEHQAVDLNKWITHDEFMQIVGVSETVPGAISVKFAAYIGYKETGIPGVAAAVTGSFIIPVFGIIVLNNFIKVLEKFKISECIIKGIKSASWGLIIGAGLRSLVKYNMKVENIIIGAGAAIGIAVFNLSPAVIIIFAGILGVLFFS